MIKLDLSLGAYVSELEKAEFAKVGDGSVSGLGGDYELNEGHLLRTHQIHGRQIVDVLHFASTQC